MKIEVRKPTDEEKREASSWPIWTKDVSTFPWSYSDRETCLLLEGEVTVEAGGTVTSFKAGDWVVFPKGLACTWNITKPVRKHYNFG